MKSKLTFLIFIMVVLLSNMIIAQKKTEDLVTDRPDQTESAVTVPLGTLQIENGFSFERLTITAGGSELQFSTSSFSSLLLRYGISESVELRATGEILSENQKFGNSENSHTGLGGFMLGAKIRLASGNEKIPDMALLMHVGLPIGDENFRPGKLEPEVIFAIAQDLSDQYSIGFNVGTSWNTDADFWSFIYSSALGISLSERVGGFVELYGDFSSISSPVHKFDTGLTYLITKTFQLDCSAGINLIGEHKFWFISGGFTIRIPE